MGWKEKEGCLLSLMVWKWGLGEEGGDEGQGWGRRG